jgi:predicted permease
MQAFFRLAPTWLTDLVVDLRYVLRVFSHSPGVALVPGLTLALGIGATTAIFSVVNGVVLRSLPYPDSENLVRIVENTVGPTGTPRVVSPLPTSQLVDFRSQATSLTDVAAFTSLTATVTLPQETARILVSRVSPSLFELLGVKPVLGRALQASDEIAGSENAVVLSYDAWQRYFAGEVDLKDQFIVVDGRRFSVMGVMPDDFRFPDSETRLWLPLTLPVPAGTSVRLPLIARVNAAVSIDSATIQINETVRRLRESSAPAQQTEANTEVQVIPISEELVAGAKPLLWLVSGFAVVVLLIASMNVTSLLLSRAIRRQREFAVRRALGAGSGRLIRQLLTESMVVSIGGGLCGVFLAGAGVRALRALGTVLPRRDLGTNISIPRLQEIGIDGSVLGFALAVSLIVGIGSGLLPALRHLRARDADALGSSAIPFRLGFRTMRAGFDAALVVTQVSMAALLLLIAGSLMQSFEKLTNVSVGFDPSNVLTFRVSLPASRSSETELAAFGDSLVTRIEALTGARTAAYTQFLPMVQTTRVIPIGRSRELSGKPPTPSIFLTDRLPPEYPSVRLVSSSFLSVMRVPIIEGRGLTEGDLDGTPQLVVNRTLARSGVLGQEVVGRLIYAGGTPFEIVGVAEDIPQLRLGRAPDPQVFVGYNQLPAGPGPNPDGSGPYFTVRTEQEVAQVSASIRQMIRQLDPQAAMHDISTMDSILANSLSRARLYAVVPGVFALTTVVLALMGIYSVLSNSVAQRWREIGIRVALGCPRGQVIWFVVGRHLTLAVLGSVVGLISASAVSRLLASVVTDVSPPDGATYLSVAMVCGVIAAVASAVPVRRATAIDPAETLRAE